MKKENIIPNYYNNTAKLFPDFYAYPKFNYIQNWSDPEITKAYKAESDKECIYA